MVENERRSYDPRRQRRKTGSPSNGKPPSIMAFQVVLCVLLLIAAFAIKQSGSSFYIKAKGYASDVVNTGITKKDVVEAFGNMKKSLFSAGKQGFSSSSGAGSSLASGSSSKAQSDSSSLSEFSLPSTASSKLQSSSSLPAASSKTSSSKLQSSSSKASSSKSASSSKTASSKTKSSSKATAAIAGSALFTGAGGADLNVFAPANVTLLPPANATLAPVRLSVTPELPVKGRLTSKFGYRIHPITKKLSFHTGVDIATKEGTPICASLSGRVADVGQSEAYGNYVLMDNGGGVTTFYGHCLEILAPKGAVLRSGDIIAKVGNTGLSTGPHLHFEIRIDNIYINPLWMLKI